MTFVPFISCCHSLSFNCRIMPCLYVKYCVNIFFFSKQNTTCIYYLAAFSPVCAARRSFPVARTCAPPLAGVGNSLDRMLTGTCVSSARLCTNEARQVSEDCVSTLLLFFFFFSHPPKLLPDAQSAELSERHTEGRREAEEWEDEEEEAALCSALSTFSG